MKKIKIDVGCKLENEVIQESVVLNLDDQEDSTPFIKNTAGISGLRRKEAIILNFRIEGGGVCPNVHIWKTSLQGTCLGRRHELEKDWEVL